MPNSLPSADIHLTENSMCVCIEQKNDNKYFLSTLFFLDIFLRFVAAAVQNDVPYF